MPNGGYCVYYPSNIFATSAVLKNWGICSAEEYSCDAFRPIMHE